MLGVVVLGERLSFIQTMSFVLAAIGVGVMVGGFGEVPIIALILAITFAIYGLVRKLAHVKPIIGLYVEMLYVAPFAFLFLTYIYNKGESVYLVNVKDDLFLYGAGLITVLPLIWFSAAVKRLKLSVVGIIQYLAPTLQFILAIVLFKEEFTKVHAITFGFIWAGIALFTFDNLNKLRKTSQSR